MAGKRSFYKLWVFVKWLEKALQGIVQLVAGSEIVKKA